MGSWCVLAPIREHAAGGRPNLNRELVAIAVIEREQIRPESGVAPPSGLWKRGQAVHFGSDPRDGGLIEDHGFTIARLRQDTCRVESVQVQRRGPPWDKHIRRCAG